MLINPEIIEKDKDDLKILHGGCFLSVRANVRSGIRGENKSFNLF